MKEIKLSKGKFAFVDDEDFEYLNQWKWCIDDRNYAKRAVNINGKQSWIKMHRIIMNAPGKMEVDHVNRNNLDNRKSNLRICTHSQNIANSKKPITNTSGVKGVHWKKNNNKWESYIGYQGKKIYIGLFDDIEKAAIAYKNKAHELFGEFARTE